MVGWDAWVRGSHCALCVGAVARCMTRTVAGCTTLASRVSRYTWPLHAKGEPSHLALHAIELAVCSRSPFVAADATAARVGSGSPCVGPGRYSDADAAGCMMWARRVRCCSWRRTR